MPKVAEFAHSPRESRTGRDVDASRSDVWLVESRQALSDLLLQLHDPLVERAALRIGFPGTGSQIVELVLLLEQTVLDRDHIFTQRLMVLTPAPHIEDTPQHAGGDRQEQEHQPEGSGANQRLR